MTAGEDEWILFNKILVLQFGLCDWLTALLIILSCITSLFIIDPSIKFWFCDTWVADLDAKATTKGYTVTLVSD